MTKWIIFDMDNTLIDTEPLYLEAMDKFATMIASLGFKKEDVNFRQGQIDASLLASMGYSTKRFAESFRLTTEEYIEKLGWKTYNRNNTGRSKQLLDNAKKLAYEVFDRISIEYNYAANVVKTFARNGYKVAVITAGERWVQMKRFDDLTMRNLFHDCWVVLHKDKEVFEDFCNKHNVEKATSWMIGDSLKSDVIPAVQAGLNAIHLNTSNWKARDGNSDLPTGALSVPDLSYTIDIILGATKNG